MARRFRRRAYVLDQIRRALAAESFQMYYQPIRDCGADRFTTAEALLRLIDGSGVPIPPGEVIPLAVENGLIDDISWLVLRKVCAFLAEHPQLPLESVSLNLSIQQLMDSNFCARVRDCLDSCGVPPEKLRIEITERVITENPELTAAVMAQLKADGVQFYLDDFGVGYSNLAGVMSLPFETVKLDASLLRNIQTEKGSNTLGLLVQMLHNAGFLVVAEGIETGEQADCARVLGVDRIQGYFYARPMPEAGLLKLLETPAAGEARPDALAAAR